MTSGVEFWGSRFLLTNTIFDQKLISLNEKKKNQNYNIMFFAKFSSTHKSFFKLLCSVRSWRFCAKNSEIGDMIDFYLFLNSLLYKFLWEVSAPRSLWSLKTFPQDFALLTLDYGIDKWSEINVGTETFGTNNKHSPLNIASVINPVAKGWYFLSTSLLFFFFKFKSKWM